MPAADKKTLTGGMMKRLFLIMVAVGLIGCTGVMKTTEGTNFSAEEIQQIKAGTSTKEDVVALLGKPDEQKSENGMVKYIYTYRVRKTPTYLGGLVVRRSGARTTTRQLEVLIKDGTVYSYKFREEIEE